MGTNVAQDQTATKAAINRQILEMKKKIQLSEGQRKALFEEYETGRKANADEILKLKKEISQLIVTLNESRNTSLKSCLQIKQLEAVIGPVEKKTSSEVKELLDLQIIDKSKQLNLLRYRIKQKQRYLNDLGKEYQTLISEHVKKQITEKVENPVRKATSELQNSIHAIEIQQREAEHVRLRYRDIRKTLLEDAAHFESNIRETEEQIKNQQCDIQRLQKINVEASRMRASARGTLLQEERAMSASAEVRQRQIEEGKRLVERRREELESLERGIFQGGKAPAKQEADEQTDEAGAQPETPEEIPPHPVEIMAHSFGILKQATGAITTEEVLERFCSQKGTLARLMLLRKTNEAEKARMEKRRDIFVIELEKLKYAEVKDTELNAQDMERVQKSIEQQRNMVCYCRNGIKKTEEVLKMLVAALHVLHLGVNPHTILAIDPAIVLQNIKNDLTNIIAEVQTLQKQISQENIDENKWMPAPYKTLLSRTPLPQSGASPAPPPPAGSDEEEEVPSRGFLKRQAQLVIDTKLRRKNVRMQPPRRK